MEEIRMKYEKDGYVRIPKDIFCLDESTIDALKKEFEKLFRGQFYNGIYPDEIHWREGLSKDNVTREICNGWKASHVISNIVCSERIGRLAASLTGWNSTRIGQDDIIHKPPLSNAVGFHQDGAYISDNFVPRANNCVTMWIAVDDADEENGALQYVPGSHRWPCRPVADVSASSFHTVVDSNSQSDADSSSVISDQYKPLLHAAQRLQKESEQVLQSIETVSVRAGEMVVHHQRLWHGSGPNRSTTRTRRALVAHLINGQVQWRTTPPPHYIYGRYYIRGETVPRYLLTN
jgi:ectoine hydroxylase-related dioxygenase (phytanoyl-CoA dioxygenase family)